mgnify:CR=1 FL=1
MAEIILYSNGCPKCRVLETKLGAKNIKFEKSDNFDKLLEQGKQSLPVLEVDGSLLDFPTANSWVNNYNSECEKNETEKAESPVTAGIGV